MTYSWILDEEKYLKIEEVKRLRESCQELKKQGIAEGTFNTSYPEEAASAYLGLFTLLMQDAKKFDPKSEVMARKFAALFDFIEKILGASQGCVLRAFLERNVPPV